MKNSEVARTFVNGGVDKGSNMFIEQITDNCTAIYSYGKHFPMAVRIIEFGQPKYFVNMDKYSISTSKHQSYVSGELSTRDTINLSTSELKKLISDMGSSSFAVVNVPEIKTKEDLMKHIEEFLKAQSMSTRSRNKFLKEFSERLDKELFTSNV